MGNQRARSQTEIKDRRQEIIDACDTLFANRGYDAVNLKEISEMTSITRTAIYTYFKTKEEIFLDILKQEYLTWQKELELGLAQIETRNKEEYCHFLTDSIVRQEKLLKLLSEHFDSIENNSRSEKLCEYKKNIRPLFLTLSQGTKQVFPDCNDTAAEHFRLFYFSSIGSLYSMTHPTEKQIAAMQATNFYKKLSFPELFYEHTLLIARDL